MEDIAELFRRYSQDILISKVNEDEWAISFKDDNIDPYVYHIEQSVFGLEYHRFTRESYRKMMSEAVENVNLDTVIAYKKNGTRHNFLDEY